MNRRLSHVTLVFGKELKETLRDRRTLAVMILFPVVVYPLLSLLVGQVVMQRESRYEDKPVRVSATPNSPAAKFFAVPAAQDALKITWVPNAKPEDVAARRLDVFVKQTGIAKTPPHPVEFIFDGSREESLRAEARLSAHFAALLMPGSAHVFAVAPKDIGTAVSRGGYILSKVVPLLVVLMVILGAFYPAIDTTAGERERNTLETTLVAPIARVDLLAGKVLAVATLALLTGLLNLGSLSLTFVQLARTAQSGSLPVPWGRLAAAAAVLPLTAVMFAAVMVMAATAAKSFKEAQNYLTPIYFAFFAPAVAASFGEFPLTYGWALVPGLNITLLTRDLILGEAQLPKALVLLASAMAVTAFALAIAARLFDSERLLAVPTRARRGTRPANSPARADAHAARAAPEHPRYRPLDATDAAMGFALASITFFILAPVGQAYPVAGTLVSQWGGMLGLALLYARVRGVPVRSSLGFTLPRPLHMLGAVLIGAGAWMVVGTLTQWLVPPNAETIKMLRDLLQAQPTPIALLLFALTPAVCEEVLFRGLILRGLLRRFPPALSVMIVSLLFGVFHFSVDRLLPTATLGLLLGFAAYRSGSLFPSIFIHACNNGILVALAASGYDERFDKLTGIVPIATFAVATIALIVGLLCLRRPASDAPRIV